MAAHKLKVFQSHLGFYDTIVAAASQKAALEAWGSHRNLFQEGFAALATDKTAVEMALANPGVVLRRPAGSKEAFSEEPSLPKIPRSSARHAPRKKPSTRKA